MTRLRLLLLLGLFALSACGSGGAATTPTGARQPLATATTRASTTAPATVASAATVAPTVAPTLAPPSPPGSPTRATGATPSGTATRAAGGASPSTPPSTAMRAVGRTPIATPMRPSFTATGGMVEVVPASLALYPSSLGLLMFGEIRNAGATDAGNFHVVVSLVDGAGRVVGGGRDVNIGTYMLAPGQRTAWYAALDQRNQPWVEERIEVQSTPLTAATPPRATDGRPAVNGLVVETFTVDQTTAPGGRVPVSGQLRNTGGAPAGGTAITVAEYDDRDRVIGLETFTGPAIPAGGSAPFSVRLLATPPAPVARYAVFVR